MNPSYNTVPSNGYTKAVLQLIQTQVDSFVHECSVSALKNQLI